MKVITKQCKLNKKFHTFEICLDVQIRFKFLDVKPFKHWTIKFAFLALSQNLEMALVQKTAPSVRFMEMFCQSSLNFEAVLNLQIIIAASSNFTLSSKRVQ